MNENTEDLTVRYLNDEASDKEAQQLLKWVKESPDHADEFMRITAIHADLRMQLTGEQVAAAMPESEKTIGDVLEPIRWQTVALALAACLLILLALNFERPPTETTAQDSRPVAKPETVPRQRPVEIRSVATLAQAEGVVWNTGEISLGQEIKPGALSIRQGLMALKFDHGVVLAVRGPAELEIRSLSAVQLTKGLLTALAPTGAEGFRVRTAHLDVVDLGTFFGVQAESNVIQVGVFEGAVALDAADGSKPETISAGKAVRVLADGARETIGFESGPFAGAWRRVSGVVNHSASIELLRSQNHGGVPWLDDTRLFLLCEGRTVELQGDLEIDVSQPGKYRRTREISAGSLPAGTEVRPYLLQFRPRLREASPGAKPEFVQIRAEVTFAAPVMGIILSDSRLAGSERKLSSGVSRKLYGRQLGLELTNREYGDEIELSSDRRTIRLVLRATAGFSDYVRVLVAERADSVAEDPLYAVR